MSSYLGGAARIRQARRPLTHKHKRGHYKYRSSGEYLYIEGGRRCARVIACVAQFRGRNGLTACALYLLLGIVYNFMLALCNGI